MNRPAPATPASNRLATLRKELEALRHAMAQRPLTATEFRRMLALSQATGEALL